MILALTGATGFVGGHLLDAATAQGHTVRALTRRPQPPREGVSWIDGGLDQPERLAVLACGADALIHVAGAINARSKAEFERVNVGGTAGALAAARGVARFVQVSSLAARQPGLSDYGWSKAEADRLVARARPDAAIVRPPAVYGPGDRETLALFRLARRGVVPVVGHGRFSIIHVRDLAAALLAAVEAPQGVYEVADATPGGFTQAGFSRAISAALGRTARVVTLPTAVLAPAAVLATLAARLTGTAPKLSLDRARYFAHPNWVANPAPLIATGRWRPTIAAADGLRETANWYAREGWL